MRVLIAATVSALRFLRLSFTHSLRLNRDRLGQDVAIDQGGTYSVFRETDRKAKKTKDETVLVVGFRLKLLHSSPVLHWVFQRVCILTTPFWSGFKGFRIKLWLVDKSTKNYLGIYQWSGNAKAQKYVNVLSKVLKPLSIPGSVWYAIYPEQFEHYVSQHVKQPRIL